MFIWITISGIVLLLLLMFIILIKTKKIDYHLDYKVLFLSGIIWFILGVVFETYFMWILGVILFVIGILNKDKWKSQPKLSELPPEKRRFKIILIVSLTLLVLIALIAFIVYADTNTMAVLKLYNI